MKSTNAIKDPKGKPMDKIIYNDKLIFEIEDKGQGKKELEFHPIDHLNSSQNEYIVEIPLNKNSSALNQLRTSIKI